MNFYKIPPGSDFVAIFWNFLKRIFFEGFQARRLPLYFREIVVHSAWIMTCIHRIEWKLTLNKFAAACSYLRQNKDLASGKFQFVS